VLLRGVPEERVFERINLVPGDSLLEVTQELAARARASWYDMIGTGTTTCTAIQTGRGVTLSASTILDNGTLRIGDLWSPNSGSDWYLITAIDKSGPSLTLNTPLKTANVIGQRFSAARPRWVKVYLAPGDYDSIYFGNALTGSAAPFVGIVASGATLTDVVGYIEGQRAVWPSQGAVSVRGLTLSSASDMTTAQSYITPADSKTYGTSAIRFQDVTTLSPGVDCFAPLGYGGSLEIIGGSCLARQDIILPRNDGGPQVIANASVSGSTDYVIHLYQRMFTSSSPLTVQNCTLTIDHTAGQPISGNSMFLDMPGIGPAAFLDCTLNFISSDASRATVCGLGSGVLTSCSVVMTRCTVLVNGAAPSSSFKLVNSATYTGAGSLTCNQCSLGSASNGGGGTFTVTINP
jgi:hypothetical protein